MVRRGKSLLIVLTGLMLSGLTGCDLSEVTVPGGEQSLVVQAVMRPDLQSQSVLVEYTLVGQQTLGPDQDAIPVTDAFVWVTNVTQSSIRCTEAIRFQLDDPPIGGYSTSVLGCPLMEAGDRLELRVQTPDGGSVFGTMDVPGIRKMDVFKTGVLLPSAEFEVFELNRDTDTLVFDVEKDSGRGLFVETRTLSGLIGLDKRFSFFVDTTSFQLVGDLLNDFEDDGGQLFRAGRFVQISVGLMDENFFRFNQTRNDPFSGRGFDNRLEGGLGVFGGLDPRAFKVKAVGDIDDPREGFYRIEMTLNDTLQLDIALELYLLENTPNAEFSAFVTGDWPGIPANTTVSLDGNFTGSAFEARLDLSIATPVQFILTGDNALEETFEVDVTRNGLMLGAAQVTR